MIRTEKWGETFRGFIKGFLAKTAPPAFYHLPSLRSLRTIGSIKTSASLSAVFCLRLLQVFAPTFIRKGSYLTAVFPSQLHLPSSRTYLSYTERKFSRICIMSRSSKDPPQPPERNHERTLSSGNSVGEDRVSSQPQIDDVQSAVSKLREQNKRLHEELQAEDGMVNFRDGLIQ